MGLLWSWWCDQIPERSDGPYRSNTNADWSHANVRHYSPFAALNFSTNLTINLSSSLEIQRKKLDEQHQTVRSFAGLLQEGYFALMKENAWGRYQDEQSLARTSQILSVPSPTWLPSRTNVDHVQTVPMTLKSANPSCNIKILLLESPGKSIANSPSIC